MNLTENGTSCFTERLANSVDYGSVRDHNEESSVGIEQCGDMRDFQRFFRITVSRLNQLVSTNQRWLFAESIEHVVRKNGNTKNKHSTLLALSAHNIKQSPDFLIAGLRDIYQKRLSIRSDIFIHSILLPLESKNDNLIEFLQRTSDTHVPFLLSLCGLPMSDITCNAKSKIADRLWKAFIHSNIPINHEAIKSRLRILIENERAFNALDMLKEAEETFEIKPDEEIFTLILQGLSMTGNISTVNSMIKEIKERNLSMNKEMKVSQIYCYLKNDDGSAMELVQNAITEYGNEIEPLIFMIRCQTAIEKSNVRSLKLLLDSLSSDLSLKSLSDEMVIKLVWLLARNCSDSMGKDHEELCTEILRNVRKGRGFFKLMIRETVRHAAHRMFYSALAYFHSDLHVSTKSMFRDLGRHMGWVGYFSKALVNADLSLAELKDLFTHISRNTHNACFVLQQILYCVLTHRSLPAQKSLLITSILLEILDPNRIKVHVVVPLLVRAAEVEQRLEILSFFVSFGYNELNHLNYGVIQKLVLHPLLMILQIFTESGKMNIGANKWNTEQLDRVVDVFKDHKIPKNIAYKLLKPGSMGIGSVEKWLKEQIILTKVDIRNCYGMFSSTLREHITNQEVDKIHAFIKTNISGDVSELFQPIFMLYIRKANWSTLMEFIKEFRNNNGCNSIPLTVDNLLLILVRHLDEFKSFNVASDFIYYLQQFVPKDLHPNTGNEKTLKKLVEQSLELPYETVQSLIACSQMFRTLADVKWIHSGSFEIVSTSFVLAALIKFGFDEALKVCSFFQFSDFPNGIICLLHYAIRSVDENLTNKALGLARTYWPEWKVSVIFGSILICEEKLEEANQLLQKANIRWINVFHTYKLMCALHLDETRDFHFNYLSLFSEVMRYNKHDEACTRLALDCLKNCTRKDPDQAYLVKRFLGTLKYNTNRLSS